MVRALDAEEVTTTAPIRIDARGNITLPMIGRVHAAGLTTEQLADVLEEHLKHYLQHPDVSVYLVETRSQPVSVLGAVQSPRRPPVGRAQNSLRSDFHGWRHSPGRGIFD
jgi:polysaccharide export outer membrane protein